MQDTTQVCTRDNRSRSSSIKSSTGTVCSRKRLPGNPWILARLRFGPRPARLHTTRRHEPARKTNCQDMPSHRIFSRRRRRVVGLCDTGCCTMSRMEPPRRYPVPRVCKSPGAGNNPATDERRWGSDGRYYIAAAVPRLRTCLWWLFGRSEHGFTRKHSVSMMPNQDKVKGSDGFN